MEPLHPEVRSALKAAHAGLTDEEIDRAEELLSMRMRLDPDIAAEQIAKLDQERMELMRRKMPRYAQVVQASKPRMTLPQEGVSGKVTVTLKKPEK
jgi:hypothetical protein